MLTDTGRALTQPGNRIHDIYTLHLIPFHTLSIAKMNPALNPDTPPPPPPKPSSHEVSRGGTPQANPSLPLQKSHDGPDWNPQPGNGNQPPYSAAMDYPTSVASLPKPPTAEEGWIPDIVKDKSYDGALSLPDATW